MSRVILGALCAVARVVPNVAGWAADAPSPTSPADQQAAATADEPAPDQQPVIEAEVIVTAPRIEIPLQQNPDGTIAFGRMTRVPVPLRSVACTGALPGAGRTPARRRGPPGEAPLSRSCRRAPPAAHPSTREIAQLRVRDMERLRRLPAEIVHAGHDPSFGRDRLGAITTAYLTRHGR